ncbi:MAG: D-glycero-alpha-D-manno-heptose-1,7-bisphosphate 7-phosphatase [Phycisphaerae bacterium]
MAERAVFLDRDNTIIANDDHLGDPSKVKLLSGAAAAIASLRRLGYRIIVVSNQSGVARGLFDEAAVESVNQEMIRQLKEQAGAHVDASYYCPYHPDAVVPEYKLDHEWRKPKPGMLKAACEDFNLDLNQCWMIGDQPRDVAAGAAVGCRTILLSDPEKRMESNENISAITPNFIVRTLADAARIIVREGNSPNRDPAPIPLTANEVPSSPQDDATKNVSNALAANPSQDAEALAAAIAGKLTGHSSEPIKPVLEDILQQLRNAHRQSDMAEFSLSLLLATMLQAVVVLCVAVGAWDGLSAIHVVATARNPYWWNYRILYQLTALEWLGGGVILQVMVVALLLWHRNKQ